MFRFLYELFVGPAIDLKNKTIATGAYFGLVVVMSLIYLVFPFGPLLVWGLLSGKAIPALAFCGFIALALGAGSVDKWIDNLQRQVRNEPLRGKPLDERIEGE